MKPKTLIVLAFLALALLSYVYFAIEKPAREKEAGGNKEDLLASGNLASIQSFKISSGDKKIELVREKIGWRMIEPAKDLASQSKVENLISALEKFKKSRILFTPPQLASDKPDLKQYSLDPAKVRLEYKTSDLAEPIVVELGQQNPSGTFSYAQTKKDGVVLATMELDFLGTQAADDFREMRLTTVASSDFEDVQIHYQGKKMKFKRENDLWVMTQPYSLPLDQDFTKSFMDKIGFIRANQFLPSLPKALSNPDLKLLVGFKKDVKDLRTSDSDARPEGLEIILGRTTKPKTPGKDRTEEFDYFAKGDKTSASTVAQFHYDNFTKAPEDFIKKTFDDFLNSQVQKITISVPQRPDLVISQNDKTFSTAQGPLDSDKVGKILDSLRNMRASKFIEISKTVRKNLGMKVTLESKDKKPITFSFDFLKNSTLLWYSNGEQILAYALAQDIIPVKDFNYEALKPVAVQVPSPSPEAKKP